jgi:hypothetical protein
MTLHAYTVVGRWQRRATLLPGLVTVAQQGHIVAQSDQTQKRRAETQRRRGAAKAAWKDSALPGWLDEGVYCVEILPRLKQVSLSENRQRCKIPRTRDVPESSGLLRPARNETTAANGSLKTVVAQANANPMT